MSSNAVLPLNLNHEVSLAMSKLARNQIREKGAEILGGEVLRGIDLNVISLKHLEQMRDAMCYEFSVHDRRKWSGNGSNVTKSGITTLRGDHMRNLESILKFTLCSSTY